jgi:hypothetical protein
MNNESELETEAFGEITLNPKVRSEEVLTLQCPECSEPISCEGTDQGMSYEFRCGCDELRRFKVPGHDE